jgi:hypothetical protein
VRFRTRLRDVEPTPAAHLRQIFCKLEPAFHSSGKITHTAIGKEKIALFLKID